jgi:SSS family solute:Na+ symporter
MKLLDWILTIIPLLIVLAIGIYTQRYMKSVADFLSGGRVAGRYLLAVSRGEMQAGAVVFVAMFEVILKSGFVLRWWDWVTGPLFLIVGISGFVIYRYRETRAMTLAQFFEIRYNKTFRLFTGVLGFLAGIANFGIIPSVGARFFVYFLGLPPEVTLLSHQIPTYIPLMAVFLGITLAIAMAGGLITIMVTDCLEGIFSQLLYLVIIVGLLSTFNWPQINSVLAAQPPGHSFLNPFDSGSLKDFNLSYILMGLFMSIYGTMAWQNASGYNSASLTPHESRMGGVLGRWRELGKVAVVTLLAVCAMTYLNHPDFAAQSAKAHQDIASISPQKIQDQMTVPVALSHLLPVGVRGALCVILLMGIFGGDSTHLHSWSSLLIQDVLVPLRKKPFGPKQHIFILRCAMAGVALFAFLFGCFFRQTEYIFFWWSITQTIYLGGAGAAIIGGLYWKKGTSAGAWVALLTGSTLSVSGILARQFYGEAFPLNLIEVGFYACLIAVFLYVVVSLLTCREDFNLERMLHRGKYAAIKEEVGEKVIKPAGRRVWLGKLAGFDEDFTLGDKWIAGGLLGWMVFWFIVFVVGSIWNLMAPWPLSVWSAFWHVTSIGLPICFAVVTAVWFTWGGLRDMRALFRNLREQRVNHLDDGTVVGHQNLDEAVLGAEDPLRGEVASKH